MPDRVLSRNGALALAPVSIMSSMLLTIECSLICSVLGVIFGDSLFVFTRSGEVKLARWTVPLWP